MNRYEIFKSLKHLEENVSQHELIGVAYGETIDDAADEIDECIKAESFYQLTSVLHRIRWKHIFETTLQQRNEVSAKLPNVSTETTSVCLEQTTYAMFKVQAIYLKWTK